MRPIRSFLAVLVFLLLPVYPATAIDPPYASDMERLAEALGSLYFLQPLCRSDGEDWRAEMAELIALEQPDEDRQQRLTGAFNAGYTAYARLHRACTASAAEALTRALIEAEEIARSIHFRYAE